MQLKRFILLIVMVLMGGSGALFAQIEVKEGSFKEVPGFINIDPDKQTDDNDQPYVVLKIRTENINAKQKRELEFKGDARTFYEVEYKDGEVWLYISYYASFLKISHPDLSSTEFYFPYDMTPKHGYELTLVNVSKPDIDEERILNLIDQRIESTTPQETLPPAPVSKGYYFNTLNVSYSNYGDLSYGVAIGNVNRFGWFLSVMSNFNFKGFKSNYTCGNDFLVDGHYPEYTGKTDFTALSAMAGMLVRIVGPLSVRVGAGYGVRNMVYEMVDGKYVKNTDESAEGLDVSLGAQVKLGKLVLSAECVTTSFKIYEAKIGLGFGIDK